MLDIDRGGSAAEDVALWTLTIQLAERKITCAFTRGTWRCDDPSWGGAGEPATLRLPRSSFIEASPRQNAPSAPFEVEVSRNGLPVFAGNTTALPALPAGLGCRQAARYRQSINLTADEPRP